MKNYTILRLAVIIASALLVVFTILSLALFGFSERVGVLPQGTLSPDASNDDNAPSGSVYDSDGVMIQTKEVYSPRNTKADNVHINQVGYYTSGTKRAIVIGGGKDFQLVRLNEDGSGRVVYYGRVENTGKMVDLLSGERCYYADFTEYTEPGTYYIHINPSESDGGVVSYTFEIADDVFSDLNAALLKMLYYHRCGSALESEHAGIYSHAECHTGNTTYQSRLSKDSTPVYIDVSGGWHEAGDYSKTVASGGAALGCILMAYEYFPSAFGDDSGIPESANSIPDVLDEARYEIDWLMKMQGEDGGVCITAFPWDHALMTMMPHHDSSNIYYVYPPDVRSTAVAVAVFEKMARLISELDPTYASLCHNAAMRGWAYIEANLANEAAAYDSYPLRSGNVNMSGKTSEAARFWAAVESYLYTGEKKYDDMAYELRSFAGSEYFKWSFGGFGTAAYALSSCDFAKNEKLYAYTCDILKKAGRKVYDSYLGGGYEIPLGEVTMNTNFYICANAFNLIAAQMLDPEKSYDAAIEGAMNYLLGSNPLDISYITGFGTNYVQNIHHRQSFADGIRTPIPGIMVFGCGLYDWVDDRSEGLDQFYNSSTPGLYCYADYVDYFRLTEVEIDSNALAVLVAAYLEDKN